MTAPASEGDASSARSTDSGGGAGESTHGQDESERFLSYEGATVPRFLGVLWIAFLIFAAVYLVRYIPSSWVEWFSRE